MKTLARILFALGIAAFCAGFIRWMMVGLPLIKEQQEQKWRARVAINLSQTDGWRSVSYVPRRTGIYSLNIEAGGSPRQSRPTANFQGKMEVEVADARGVSIRRFPVDGSTVLLSNAPFIHWDSIGYFECRDISAAPWTLRARVLVPDPRFSGESAAVNMEPPHRQDVGWAGLFFYAELIFWIFLGTVLLSLTALFSWLEKRKAR